MGFIIIGQCIKCWHITFTFSQATVKISWQQFIYIITKYSKLKVAVDKTVIFGNIIKWGNKGSALKQYIFHKSFDFLIIIWYCSCKYVFLS